MDLEPKFWRLLTAYEHLTREETVALREQNFAYLSEVQGNKSDVFAELQGTGELLGIDRTNSELNRRLELLEETDRSNVAFATEFLSTTRAVLQTLNSNGNRLTGFRHVYAKKLPTPGERTFSAQG